MPKFTFYAVLQLLRLVISFVDKCIRLIYSIIDLVDDGCKNNSVAVPEWFTKVEQVLSYLQVSSSSIREILSDNSEFGE